MSPEPESEVAMRLAAKEDAHVCGQICYDAFAAINPKHGFPPDFPGPEVA
jgi:hypothetical protein